eukprot:GGOE01013086.1.p1 GENE.GGOE01013086.1~~GGOE01013086.1.p1  ORF type:complete len:321 (-),score=118.25 GGOE01013086.1:1151-2113(-)
MGNSDQPGSGTTSPAIHCEGKHREEDPTVADANNMCGGAAHAPIVLELTSDSKGSSDAKAVEEQLVAGIQLQLSPDLLGSSSNVLLLFQLQRIEKLSFINLFLSCLCLVYFGICIILLILNSLNAHDREESVYTFHTLEFWSTFVFSLVDVVAVMHSPRPLRNICDKPQLLKLLMSLNITVSFVPAVLITSNIERYEMIAHQIEYSNEMSMVFVDLVILFSLVKVSGLANGQSRQMLLMVVFAFACCITQFLVYNLLGEEGEQIAHYLEFCVDMLSAGTLFWFCMDNKLLADQWMRSIMLQGICPSDCVCCALTGGGEQV